MATRWRCPRKLFRLAVEQLIKLQGFCNFFDLALTFSLGNTGEFQRKTHIVANVHMRVERIGLENHGKTALVRRRIVDTLPVNGEITSSNFLEPGDHAQKR